MKKGVGSLDPGLGKASGAIEYTMMRASDAVAMVNLQPNSWHTILTDSPTRFWQAVDFESRLTVCIWPSSQRTLVRERDFCSMQLNHVSN